MGRKQEQEADAKFLEEAQKREVTTATIEDEMKNKARYELEIYIFCVREQSRIHQKLPCLISSLCLFDFLVYSYASEILYSFNRGP